MGTLKASNGPIIHLFRSYIEMYSINWLEIEQGRLRSLVKSKDYVQLVRNGNIGAILDETPYINMVMSKYYGEFIIVVEPLYRQGFGIVSVQ